MIYKNPGVEMIYTPGVDMIYRNRGIELTNGNLREEMIYEIPGVDIIIIEKKRGIDDN